jgi:hypothetical protein
MQNKEKMTKTCPECQQEIIYKSITGWYTSCKKKSVCKKCGIKKRVKTAKKNGSFKGENNPFFGKKHSKETIEHLSKDIDRSYTKTEQFKKNISIAMNGKTNRVPVYDCWIKKYGKEKADELDKKRKEKWSKSSSGKNNSMYGKPSPQGSGNGWSGWYNNYYFRSIRELSYIIKFLERFNLDWKSAESIKIKYFFYGKDRTYCPDFIINSKYLIEIKPRRLWNTPNIIEKRKAAELYCKENNLIFKIRDIKPLNSKKIQELVNNGRIKWLKRYEQKWKEYYESSNT